MDNPLVVLLLPRPLESFILRDQAEDLLRSPHVVAIEPGRVPYGVLGRLPAPLAARMTRRLARRLRLPGTPRAVAIFHPFQYPLARAILDRHPGAELWYGRWDRYERAYDADEHTRARLDLLHANAAERSALTFAVSEELAAGSRTEIVPLAADSFPAPDPSAAVIAVSLGHQGWRNDWALLRAVAERMPELTVLFVGERHDGEMRSDEDFAWCAKAPQFVWLGSRSDEEAARLMLCADVGLVPFERSEFNDGALPYRILKYARLGRRTIAPPFPGMRTWEQAIDFADGPDEWVAALRAAAGRRTDPDVALREWALAQTAHEVNAPLRRRMAEIGVPYGQRA